MSFPVNADLNHTFIAKGAIGDMLNGQHSDDGVIFIAVCDDIERDAVVCTIKDELGSTLYALIETTAYSEFDVSGASVVIASPVNRIDALRNRLPAVLYITTELQELRCYSENFNRSLDALEVGHRSYLYRRELEQYQQQDYLALYNHRFGLKSMYYSLSDAATRIFGDNGWEKKPTNLGSFKLADL